MKLWWTWVRRSYAPYFLPVGIGVALALRLTETTHEFRYEWQWASAESGRWLFYAGALIAGASAWEAWLTRRRNEALTTGSPNHHAGRFSVFIGAAAWWLALHLLIVGAHLSVAAWSGAIGEPALLHLLAQVAAVAGWCGLGAAVGWWIRSPLAAPTLAALILLSVPDPIPDVTLRGLTWFGSDTSLVGLRFEPVGLVLKLCFFTGLVLLMIETPRRITTGRALAALGLTTAVAAAVPAVVLRADLEPVPVADHACTMESEITVCGPPEIDSALPTVGRELGPIVADLRGLGVAPPTTFRVHGLGGAAAAEPGIGWLPISGAPRHSGLGIPRQALVQAATVPTSCGEPSAEKRNETMVLREAVYGWALNELGVDVPHNPPLYSPDLINDLRTIPTAAQRGWFVDTYTALWHCAETGLRLPEGVSHPSVSTSTR